MKLGLRPMTVCSRCVTLCVFPSAASHVCERCSAAVCASHLSCLRGSKAFHELCSGCAAEANSAMQLALDKYVGGKP